ncbi:MAG TPA: hypothetical protein VF470_04370, partial [Sphingomicrobium sp.]
SCARIISDFKAETAKPDPERERHEQRRQEQQDALRGVDAKRPSASAKKTGSDDPEAIWREAAAEERRAAVGR